MTYFHRKHVCIANISVMMTNSRSRSVPWTLLLATFALAIVIADPVLATLTMGGIDESEDSTSPHLTEAGLLELALDTDADVGGDVDDEDDEQLGAQYLLDDPPASPASPVDKVLCFATVFKDVASGINSLACPAKQEECPKAKTPECVKAKVDFMIVGQNIFRLVVSDPSNWAAYYQLVTEVCVKGKEIVSKCDPSCKEKTNSALESIQKMCGIGASLAKCTAMPVSLQLDAKSSDMGSMQLTPADKGVQAAGTGTTAANTATGKATAANPATGNVCTAPNGHKYPLSYDNVCNEGCPQPGYCSDYCKCPGALQMVSDALQAFIDIKASLKDWKGNLQPPEPSTASPQCQSAKAAEDLFSCTLDTISFINNIVSGKFKIPSSLKDFVDLMNADSLCKFLNSGCGANAAKLFPPLNPIKTACGLGSLLANLIICTPVGNMMGQSLPTACQLTIEYGKPVGYEGCPLRFNIGEVNGCNSDGKGKSSDDVFIQCKELVGQAADKLPECRDSIRNFFNWGVDVAPSCEPWPDAECPTNQCKYSCLSSCIKSAIANRDSKCPLPAQQVVAQGSTDGKCGQVVRPTKANECPKTAKFTGNCIPPDVWQYLGACQGAFGTKVDWSGKTCCQAFKQWCEIPTGSGYNILAPLPVSSEVGTAIKASLDMSPCNSWCSYKYGGDGKCGPFKSTSVTCCNEPAGLTCYPFEKKCT